MTDSKDPSPQQAVTRETSLGTVGSIPVSEIMTRDVVSVQLGLSVTELEALFMARSFSGAPVVDAIGRPVGVVSKTDVLQHRIAGGSSAATVSDVMTPGALVVYETEPIAKAAALMAYEGVHRVPVLAAHGAVVGLVSPLDVMRWFARACGYAISNRP